MYLKGVLVDEETPCQLGGDLTLFAPSSAISNHVTLFKAHTSITTLDAYMITAQAGQARPTRL